jgi:SAM-dependent methyltransferase
VKGSRFHRIPTYAEVASLVGRPRTILDVGCSEGFFLGELEGVKLRVGVDRDWQRLQLGRRARQGVAFVRADAAALPFADGAFDSLVTIGVLSYLPDVRAAIAEGARVLAPSGRLVATVATDRPLYRLLATHVRRRGARLLDRALIASLMADAGLSLVSSYEKGYIVSPVLNLFYTAASLIDRRVLGTETVLGPLGRWARAWTNPLIRLEYRLKDRPGNTSYIAADKR